MGYFKMLKTIIKCLFIHTQKIQSNLWGKRKKTGSSKTLKEKMVFNFRCEISDIEMSSSFFSVLECFLFSLWFNLFWELLSISINVLVPESFSKQAANEISAGLKFNGRAHPIKMNFNHHLDGLTSIMNEWMDEWMNNGKAKRWNGIAFSFGKWCF